MALYLISYDVPEQNAADYQPLWNCLEELGATRILWSQWVVMSTNPVALFDMLKALLGSTDGLVVQEITRESFNYQNLRISETEMSLLLKGAR